MLLRENYFELVHLAHDIFGNLTHLVHDLNTLSDEGVEYIDVKNLTFEGLIDEVLNPEVI